MDQAFFIDMLLVVCTLALMIAFVLYQVRTLRWLKRHGRQIVAMITSIRHETKKTLDGSLRENYYITARWTDPRTGQTYNFWTWIMDSSPDYRQGNLVSILVDPNNPRRYLMEL